MRNILKRTFVLWSYFVRFLVFELRSILYFPSVVHSGHEKIQNFFEVRKALPPQNPRFYGGFCLQDPDAFEYNPHLTG